MNIIIKKLGVSFLTGFVTTAGALVCKHLDNGVFKKTSKKEKEVESA